MAEEQRGMRKIQEDIEAGGVGVLAGALLSRVVGIFLGLATARTARTEAG